MHKLFLVFASKDEARTVYRLWQREKYHLDSVFLKPTDTPPSGVSVEDARFLSHWQEVAR